MGTQWDTAYGDTMGHDGTQRIGTQWDTTRDSPTQRDTTHGDTMGHNARKSHTTGHSAWGHSHSLM